MTGRMQRATYNRYFRALQHISLAKDEVILAEQEGSPYARVILIMMKQVFGDVRTKKGIMYELFRAFSREYKRVPVAVPPSSSNQTP